eukprot:TRINITY_DN10399_c0_g1_i1.p1 TRINITY_DN10399_c0_g1~~TRINITY_DN10399_c0_g1_i1.p1  ORF type:complete len:197 (+),score=39.42 TRINITY_DN10399_c0_g1_i1:86-592(+)
MPVMPGLHDNDDDLEEVYWDQPQCTAATHREEGTLMFLTTPRRHPCPEVCNEVSGTHLHLGVRPLALQPSEEGVEVVSVSSPAAPPDSARPDIVTAELNWRASPTAVRDSSPTAAGARQDPVERFRPPSGASYKDCRADIRACAWKGPSRPPSAAFPAASLTEVTAFA